MGGLRKWLPFTHATFAAATAAIIGLPFTSGFFSKDEILYRAFVDRTINPMAESPMLRRFHLYAPPEWLGPVLYVVAVLAATLTAFYMCRLYFLTFWGDFKGWTVGRPSLLAKQELAGKGDEHGDHHEEDLSTPGYPPHESPWQMTVPLMILATFSLFAGILNPGFGLLKEKPLDHWLEPVFKSATEGAVVFGHGNDAAWAEHMEWPLAMGGIGAFAHRHGPRVLDVRRARRASRRRAWRRRSRASTSSLLDKWRVDEFYDATVVVDGRLARRHERGASTAASIDGILARFTAVVVAASGTILRALQNGVVHVYAATMVVGHRGRSAGSSPCRTPTRRWSTPATTTTSSRAAPGVGYALPVGLGRRRQARTSPTSAQDPTLKLHLEPGKSTTVKLEVKNAFGLVQRQTISVARPHAPMSSL